MKKAVCIAVFLALFGFMLFGAAKFISRKLKGGD